MLHFTIDALNCQTKIHAKAIVSLKNIHLNFDLTFCLFEYLFKNLIQAFEPPCPSNDINSAVRSQILWLSQLTFSNGHPLNSYSAPETSQKQWVKIWSNYSPTRRQGALRVPTSSWRPFGSLDFVLRAIRVLTLCDPRQGDTTLLTP